jgi:O-antigen/teichoic acid export membrane protein
VSAASGVKIADDISNRGIGVLHGSSLLRNGLYNVGGQSVRGIVGLLTIPFLIRILGIREYGIWSLAYAVLALMIMSEAGISVAVTVFLSKDRAEDDLREASRTLTFILVSAVLLSIALGLFLWYAGPLLVQWLPAFGTAERADAGRALRIASFAVSILIGQRTLIGVEQAFDRYATINTVDLCQSLLASAGLVVVAWLGGRTVAMMKWQILVSAVITLAHCYIVYRLLRGKGITLQWSGRKARRILNYSVATWAATLGTAAFSQCDRLIVAGVLGAPLLGIYSAITGISSKINSFSGTAVQPLVPSLSRDAGRNVPAETQIRNAAHLNSLIATEAGIVLYVMADWIMQVLVPGATTRQEILALEIAAVIYALYSLNALGFYVLFAFDQPRTNAFVVLSSGIVSLVLIFVAARYFGLVGAVAGNVGYLGTLFLITSALRQARIALRQYLAWVTFPVMTFLATLIVGITLQGRLWWRATFLLLQAALFLFWFLCRSTKVSICQT